MNTYTRGALSLAATLVAIGTFFLNFVGAIGGLILPIPTFLLDLIAGMVTGTGGLIFLILFIGIFGLKIKLNRAAWISLAVLDAMAIVFFARQGRPLVSFLTWRGTLWIWCLGAILGSILGLCLGTGIVKWLTREPAQGERHMNCREG